MPQTRLGPGPEFDLIRRFLGEARVESGDVSVGPGDDAAVLAGGVVLSTDMSVEGIHFRREWIPSFDIGWRCAAGALSDLAAMAARPVGLLASLALSPEDAEAEGVEVMRGVEACVASVGGTLLGGDLTRSPGPIILDVTVVGRAERPALRSAGELGDELWVTGALGGAAACVRALLRGHAPSAAALERFARPIPRTREALWLAHRGVVRAMIDLSDGIAGDAAHLAAASGLGVVLEAAAIPIHQAAREAGGDPEAALLLAASGGEDYELCFSAAPGAVGPMMAEFQAATGIPLTQVGTLVAGDGVAWLQPDGSHIRRGLGGYQHFGEHA